MKLFIDDSVNKSGYPLFPTNSESIDWSNTCLINLGHAGYIHRFLELVDQGICSLRKINNHYYINNISKFPGREALSNEDFYWWQNQLHFSLDEENKLAILKPIINAQLIDSVDVWRENFIQYTCTEELDQYYDILGKHYGKLFVGSDAFPLEAKFGNLKYGEIIQIMEAIIGYALKHKDHCFMLLKKSNYKINPWNIYTISTRLDDLAASISIHKSLNYSDVYDFINLFALTKQNVKELGNSPGSSPPPLIKISEEQVLRSVAGALSNPFTYLLRSLKLNYEKNFFKAVNDRDEYFKMNFTNFLQKKNFSNVSQI